ncbi:MAG: TIGR02996 domain-containing protein [Planctomycetales bacterium]
MEHERFLADITAHPDDDAPKLVYADWLEERGDKRAEFIRLVVEGVDGREATGEEICETSGTAWVAGGRDATIMGARLTRELWPLFAADCAGRVLPNFERENLDDDRPHKAMAAARLERITSAWSGDRASVAALAKGTFLL